MFGELGIFFFFFFFKYKKIGLLLKKPRAATILAKENTEFAIMNAEDYRNILMVVEMKKMNDRIKFIS
jgi:hypothetical protein